MVPTRYLLALCALVVLAGCGGGPGAPSATPSASATQSPTPTASETPAAPATSTLSGEAVGQRVIHAEQTRVRERAEEYDQLAEISFGILKPAEYEVDRRNSTGVFVEVTVGYSSTLDCDDGRDPAVDGATTEATYFATEDELHLLNVSQDVVDLGSYC